MRGLFLIALVVAGYLLYKLHFQRLLAQGRIGRIKIGLIGLGLVFLALAVSGRAPAVFAVIGALMTQAMRFWPLLVRFAPDIARKLRGSPFGGDAAGAPGRVSQVRTATILMSLDHESGRIDGEVLAGSLAGRTLSSLSSEELRSLYAECRANDPEALRLLEAYVARERAGEFDGASSAGHGQGEGARDGAGGSASADARAGSMSIAEAREVLGVGPEATREEIVRAHRSLMGKLHPDKGGSDYLASKVNTARETLLGKS